MPVWTRIANVTLAALLAGCAGSGGLEEGADVRSVYGSGHNPTLRIQTVESPIAREKVVPVVTAPEIFALYVPGHVDPERDMYVGEHWLFVKLRESNWKFSDRNSAEIPKKPATPRGAAEMNRLRVAMPRIEAVGRILVPHEEKPKREPTSGK